MSDYKDLKINAEIYENKPENVVEMIDSMMSSGAGRLKINVSEEVESGSFQKKYHHGRCDINSPFACGTVFDLLEEN